MKSPDVQAGPVAPVAPVKDRKSTRLNSSHLVISYAVFCLKKKKYAALNLVRLELLAAHEVHHFVHGSLHICDTSLVGVLLQPEHMRLAHTALDVRRELVRQ